MQKQLFKMIYFNTIDEIRSFVNILNKYDNISVDITSGINVVDGKSYLGVLALGSCKNLKIEFSDYNEQLMTELNNYNIK